VRDVAGALQLSLPDELRHRRPRGAALRRRARLGVPWRAGVARLVLPPGGGVAAPPGDPFPAVGDAALPVYRLAHLAAEDGGRVACPEGAPAVGGADRAAVRGGRLDRVSAHADAGHPSLKDEG